MQKKWLNRAKELLEVIERRPIRSLVTSEIRENFRDVLAMTEEANYLIMHYREPRAVLTNVETFEAMRRLTLIVSELIGEIEQEQEAPEEVEPTTVSREAWEQRIAEAIKVSRREAGRKRRPRGQKSTEAS